MAETAAHYNARIIDEFRANGGRVGGMWEEHAAFVASPHGAGSGVDRVNPVAYLPDASRYFIWAANEETRRPSLVPQPTSAPEHGVEVGSGTIEVVAQGEEPATSATG